MMNKRQEQEALILQLLEQTPESAMWILVRSLPYHKPLIWKP